MEQMPNSEQNAQITSVCPTCHNTMLGAGAYSSDDVSNEKSLELSAPTNCPLSKEQIVNAKDLLKLISNAVPKSERMNFVVPFEKYKNVLNALELCESIIEKMALSTLKQENLLS